MAGLRKVFALSVAVFFMVCLSSVTFAMETEYSLKGQVVSLDSLAQKLTVKSTDKIPALFSGTLGDFTFSIDKMTKVTMCNQEKPVEDVKVGQEVTVSYHELDGQLYADAIAMPAPLMACLLQGNEQ
jgi:ribosome biogenesis SPOUT family RNA methylase Rps3